MAAHEPPVAAREKGERITLVFSVPNVKQGSVHIDYAQDSGTLVVSFSSVSPTRRYEKQLRLPLPATPGKFVSDVQSKCVTVQLLKADADAAWGTGWLKPAKAKGKARPGAPGAPAAAPESPSLRPAEGPPGPAVEEAGAAAGADAGEAALSEEPVVAAAEAAGTPAAERHYLPDGSTPQKPKDGDDDGCPWQDTNKMDNLDAKACGDKGGDADCPPTSGTKSKTAKSRKKAGAPAADELAAARSAPAERPTAADTAGAAVLTVGPQAKAKAKAKAKACGDRGGDTDSLPTPGAKSRSAKSGKKDSKVSETDSVGDHLRAGARPKTQGPGAQGGGQLEQVAAADFGTDDVEVMRLLQQANAVWTEREDGRKKAVVLFKLAGRKGYAPAYALLAQRAIGAGDIPLAVEAICSLLGHKDAHRQCGDSLLGSCADQLAEVLRDPAHADLLMARVPELERLKKAWPALQVLLVLAAVRKGGGGGVASALQDLAGKQAHSKTLIEEIASTPSSSSGSSPRPKAAPVPPLIEVIEEVELPTSTSDGSAAKKTPENIARLTPKLREKLRDKGILNAEELQSASSSPSSPSGAAQTSGSARLPAGAQRWSEDAAGWCLTAEVPDLARLADASLDVSDAEVCLLGTGGACLLRERLPPGAGACAAERASVRWSQRKRRLTLTLPRCSESGRAAAAVNQLD